MFNEPISDARRLLLEARGIRVKAMDPVLLHRKYEFRWDTLDVIINGRSAIDSSQGFQIQNLEEADRFIKSYGYDLSNPIERAEAFGNFQESLNFIRRYFLQPENPEGLKLEIPRKILELTDIRELFLMSNNAHPLQTNDGQSIAMRNWACSLLKVMHTVAHIDQDLRTPHFAEIQKQIFDRFYRHVHRDGDGKLILGDADTSNHVELVAFDTKPKKSRDSVLLKLLHKPENVAEDIFDRVGIRFVTRTRLGALRTIKFLKDQMVVMPPNIKPSRSRNTLIDLDDFRSHLTDLLKEVDQGRLTEAELVSRLEEAAHPLPSNPDNPHTSEFYRAIQFTCRQLIKLRNPLYEDLRELKALAKSRRMGDEEATKIVDRIDFKNIQREIRFFYPYEVQVVDQRTFEENERGRSAHREYKRSQLLTALRRVMGALADANRS